MVTAKTGSWAGWDGTFAPDQGRDHSRVVGSLFPYLFASIQQKTRLRVAQKNSSMFIIQFTCVLMFPGVIHCSLELIVELPS